MSKSGEVRATASLKVLGFTLAGSLLGQAPAAVQVEQEPKHKVVFKNEFVRIIDATLPAGYVTLNHTHDADNISVTISNGREGEAATRGLGRAGFARGGYSHSVTNSGPGVMRYIVVEPLKADRPHATSALPPNHTLETENDRVRIYRIKLAIGESLASHVHETGRVEVTVSGPEGPGASRWVPGGVNHSLQAPTGSPAVEVVEIEPK